MGTVERIPWHRSIRVKLVAAAIAVEMVMLALLLANSFRLFNDTLESQTRSRLDALAPLLNASLSGRVFQRDHYEIQSILDGLVRAESSDIPYVVVYAGDRDLLAHAGTVDPAHLPPEDTDMVGALKSLIYHTSVTLDVNGTAVGRVHFGLSLQALAQARDTVLRQGGVIAALEVLFSLVLLSASGYLITRHIPVLVRASRRIAEGAYDTRVPGGPGDEIGVLAGTFNAMAGAIERHVAELQRTQRQLDGERSQLRAMLDNIPHFAWLTDAEGRFIAVNRRFAAAEAKGWVSHLAETSSSDETDPQVTERMLELEGHRRWFEIFRAPIPAADGGRLGSAGIALDITDRKEGEVRLQRIVQELSRSNTELERFAYIASHDLQEPLRHIITFCQLLERQLGVRLADNERETLAMVTGAARRMRDLVQDLLDYSQVAASSDRRVETRLSDVVAQAKRALHGAILDSGAEILLDGDVSFPAIRFQMIQVLQNLIGNALKFRRPDHPAVVRITGERCDGQIRITVSDNGIGIDVAYLEQIFVIFKRLHRPSEIPGTGIGLAICRRILEHHNGRIWAESGGPGQGTTFYLTLPAGTE